MTLDGVYARACAAVPELAGFVAPGSLPGTVLADPGWLDERVTAAAHKWSVADRRVVGTVWWYSASSTLLAPPVTTLVVTGHAADPTLGGLTLGLRPDGYLSGARARALAMPGRAGGAVVLGEALRGALGEVIVPLSQVSGATERALWAIATDSLATWALRAGTATGDVDRSVDISLAVARAVGPVMPVPRYVEIPVTPPRRYVRRASCCLIYEVPDCDKCTSCPRRPPADRLQRLTTHALATR